MIHLITGVILLILGAWGIIGWWGDFGAFLRGLVPLLLVLVGLAAIGAAFRKTVSGEAGYEDVEEPGAATPVHPVED